MMSYMLIWNRVLYLTEHDPESEEIPRLLAKLDQLDREGGAGYLAPSQSQRRDS
jgi:hypothetical protein